MKNCCLSPVGSVRLSGFSFMSDLNLVCKFHHLFLYKWLTLETKHTCSGRCVFQLSGFLDDAILASLCPCLCLIFAGIPAKSAPGTRTNLNFFLGTSQTLIPLHNLLTGSRKIFTTAGPGTATALAGSGAGHKPGSISL